MLSDIAASSLKENFDGGGVEPLKVENYQKFYKKLHFDEEFFKYIGGQNSITISENGNLPI